MKHPKYIRKEVKDFISLLRDNYPIMHLKPYLRSFCNLNKNNINYIKNELIKTTNHIEGVLTQKCGTLDFFEINNVSEKVKDLPLSEKHHYIWLNYRFIELKDMCFYILNVNNYAKNN